MLRHLRPWKRRKRKIWLYVIAWWHRPDYWSRLDQLCQNLIDAAELFADGLVGQADFKKALVAVTKIAKPENDTGRGPPPFVAQRLLNELKRKHLPGWEEDSPFNGVERLDLLDKKSKRIRDHLRRSGEQNVATEEQVARHQKFMDEIHNQQTSLLRDIFGNPFRPVTIDPTWLVWKNSTVVKLAQTIYDDRTFQNLPILADAFEDAGCQDGSPGGAPGKPGAMQEWERRGRRWRSIEDRSHSWLHPRALPGCPALSMLLRRRDRWSWFEVTDDNP